MVVSCKSQDENINTIETVLEHSFTGPEQELIEIWNNIYRDEASWRMYCQQLEH